MSVRHKRHARSKLGSFEGLALQSHQISGTADPHVPMRMLLALGESRSDEGPAQFGGGRRRHMVRKLNDPDAARLINERLAPGGLN